MSKNNNSRNLKPNDWRQDKAKVMRFINNNPYIIRKKIIKIIPKTRKNTWKEIKEDLKRQYLIEYNRRKSIRDKKQEQKAKPIDFIQSNIFTEPKEINEPYYPNVEDLFNQATDLEIQKQNEILNKELELTNHFSYKENLFNVNINKKQNEQHTKREHLIDGRPNSNVYVYVYIGMYVWMCVCMCILSREREREREREDFLEP